MPKNNKTDLPNKTSIDVETAFGRYEEIKERFAYLPSLGEDIGHSKKQLVKNLLQIASKYEVIVFDSFGVLNVGDTAIPGACDCVAQLRKMGKDVFVLTNAASYGLDEAVEKYRRFGFDFLPEEIISSRMVCERALRTASSCLSWGFIAPRRFSSKEVGLEGFVLRDEPASYDGVEAFLFLSTEVWSSERQVLLEESLRKKRRPVVIANPDLVAPRETGLSLEPGFYAHALLDALPDLDMRFFGKPFDDVYDAIEAKIVEKTKTSIDREKILMLGDSPHTDILGANRRYWHSGLVTDHGFLRGRNISADIERSHIRPNWILPSI